MSDDDRITAAIAELTANAERGHFPSRSIMACYERGLMVPVVRDGGVVGFQLTDAGQRLYNNGSLPLELE